FSNERTVRQVSLVRLLSDGGICPDNKLECPSSFSRLTRLPICCDIFPLRLLLERSMRIKLHGLLNSVGSP
ncbi:unnamed protein product, partial [Musa textilis]